MTKEKLIEMIESAEINKWYDVSYDWCGGFSIDHDDEGFSWTIKVLPDRNWAYPMKSGVSIIFWKKASTARKNLIKYLKLT